MGAYAVMTAMYVTLTKEESPIPKEMPRNTTGQAFDSASLSDKQAGSAQHDVSVAVISFSVQFPKFKKLSMTRSVRRYTATAALICGCGS
jgi:hypothetical protein